MQYRLVKCIIKSNNKILKGFKMTVYRLLSYFDPTSKK